jgi:hypothetical protein
MHDWTRVSAGIFHAFHNSWITHIQESLNGGELPKPYYALGEQRAGDFGPDVLTLKADEEEESLGEQQMTSVQSGMMAVAQTPPKVRKALEAAEDIGFYLQRQRSVVIRHMSGDRVVAIIEIVSPTNRHSLWTLNDFIDKIVASLQQGIHFVVVDPFPPSRNDPSGIHGLIWERLLEGGYETEADLPLTLVSYTAGHPLKAWIEPYALGSPLTAMPLFLTTEHYIPLPLEATYNQSWKGVPERWKRVIVDGSSSA